MSERNVFKRDSRRNRRAAAWVKRMLPMKVSDAKAWLTALPAVRDLVFANARGAGLVEYDKKARLWIGTSYRNTVQLTDNAPEACRADRACRQLPRCKKCKRVMYFAWGNLCPACAATVNVKGVRHV